MSVIWSFSTGSPIYSSHQAPTNKDEGRENASAAKVSGLVECGDDWSLYMHDNHFGKMVFVLALASIKCNCCIEAFLKSCLFDGG